MPLVAAYHRPRSLEQALELLRRPQRVPLAGGTVLNADREPSELEAVDLQALGLDGIASVTGAGGAPRVRLGATATLDAVRRSDLVPGALRDLARAEAPSTLRTLATVGGLVAAAPAESLLLAGLLAHGARVEVAGPSGDAPERAEHGLAEVMAAGVSPGSIITALEIDPGGRSAVARTGRTPGDVPIVAAYGRQAPGALTVALSGAAGHPVLVDPADPAAGLAPVGDFRGSAAYRLHLARTLTARVVAELTG